MEPQFVWIFDIPLNFRTMTHFIRQSWLRSAKQCLWSCTAGAGGPGDPNVLP